MAIVKRRFLVEIEEEEQESAPYPDYDAAYELRFGILDSCGFPEKFEENPDLLKVTDITDRKPVTYEELMTILEEEIVGDGQGYPDQDERERAARRILDTLDTEQRAESSLPL